MFVVFFLKVIIILKFIELKNSNKQTDISHFARILNCKLPSKLIQKSPKPKIQKFHQMNFNSLPDTWSRDKYINE